MSVKQLEDLSATTAMIIDSLKSVQQCTNSCTEQSQTELDPVSSELCKYHLNAASSLLQYLIQQHFPEQE